MTLIDYIKTIPGLNNHIVIDQFETWGSSIFYLVDSSKNELKSYLEERQKIEKIRNRTNRPTNIYEEKWNSVVSKVNDYLSNKKIIGFHCARLMECEIEDILKNGLSPLTPDFACRKINLAYNLKLIPLDLKEKLIHKDEYNEKSNRPNRVHLTHNTLTLRQEMGLHKFFKFWGGEAIYVGFEDNLYLQKIGIPCIVVAEVDYQDLIELNICQRLISIFVDNCHFYDHECDSEIPHKVKVLAVIKSEEKLFNLLTNSNNWDEKFN